MQRAAPETPSDHEFKAPRDRYTLKFSPSACRALAIWVFVIFPQPTLAETPAIPLEPADAEASLTLHGIPFLKSKEPKNLVPGLYPTSATCSAMILAGMTTASSEASDRWGMNEPAHAYEGRLFIGDRLSLVIIRYSDDILEQVPVHFGVSA